MFIDANISHFSSLPTYRISREAQNTREPQSASGLSPYMPATPPSPLPSMAQGICVVGGKIHCTPRGIVLERAKQQGKVQELLQQPLRSVQCRKRERRNYQARNNGLRVAQAQLYACLRQPVLSLIAMDFYMELVYATAEMQATCELQAWFRPCSHFYMRENSCLLLISHILSCIFAAE